MKKLILISLLSLLINSCVPLVGGFLAWKTTYPVFGEKIINGIERKKMYKKSGIYAITKEEYKRGVLLAMDDIKNRKIVDQGARDVFPENTELMFNDVPNKQYWYIKDLKTGYGIPVITNFRCTDEYGNTTMFSVEVLDKNELSENGVDDETIKKVYDLGENIADKIRKTSPKRFSQTSCKKSDFESVK